MIKLKYLIAMIAFLLTMTACGEEPEDFVICEFVVFKIIENQEQIQCKPVETINSKGEISYAEEDSN